MLALSRLKKETRLSSKYLDTSMWRYREMFTNGQLCKLLCVKMHASIMLQIHIHICVSQYIQLYSLYTKDRIIKIKSRAFSLLSRLIFWISNIYKLLYCFTKIWLSQQLKEVCKFLISRIDFYYLPHIYFNRFNHYIYLQNYKIKNHFYCLSRIK